MNKTQVCSKCREEKPLTDFYRRADTYQRTCKSCASAAGKERYAKHGRNRITTSPIIDKSNIPALSEIVAGLESALRAKAARFASDPLEADDVYSAMVEAILTKSSPTDNTVRLLGRANWAATEYLNKKRTYDYRVNPSDDDSEAFTVRTSAEDEVVERETSEAMKNVISQLPEDYQQIVSFLAVGMTQREIANKLNISAQAVSQKVQSLGSKMISLGFAPT